MAKLDVTQLDSELRSGRVHRVYVIVGPEGYLRRTALVGVERAVLGEKPGEGARQVFSGREVQGEEVLDAVKSVPMFSAVSLVVVRDGEKLSKEMLDRLADYIEKPIASSTLVIDAEKLDGRSRFMKIADKNAAVVECKALYANQLPSWINMEARRYGKKIAMDAARFLAEMTGNDLGQLAQAVERVSLYVGDRGLVELKDIEEAVIETAQRTVFELGDAIGARRADRALKVLDNLIDAGQAPVFIVNMIARHVRLLTKAREMDDRRADPATIARYLGVHPFFAKAYAEQAMNFSARELRRFFQSLARCDRELKSMRLPRERILERLVFELCGAGPTAARRNPASQRE